MNPIIIYILIFIVASVFYRLGYDHAVADAKDQQIKKLEGDINSLEHKVELADKWPSI